MKLVDKPDTTMRNRRAILSGGVTSGFGRFSMAFQPLHSLSEPGVMRQCLLLTSHDTAHAASIVQLDRIDSRRQDLRIPIGSLRYKMLSDWE
jgi:hypothetical protein